MDLEVPAAILEGRSQKELDDEIKKKKEKQVFFWNSKIISMMELHCLQKLLDDIGVVVSMVTITLIAVIVVTFKVILFYQKVTIVNKYE